MTAILVGILARGCERFPSLRLIGAVFLSNHCHLLVWVPDSNVLAGFMHLLKTKAAREANRLHDWSGHFWEARYDSAWVSEEEGAQVGRLKYLLSQGVKEGIVERPEDWPGLHCAEALASGRPLEGLWIDRTRACRAKGYRRGGIPEGFTQACFLSFAKLPCWEHLSDEAYRNAIAELQAEIVEEGNALRREKGIRLRARRQVRRALCRVHPHTRPSEPSWSAEAAERSCRPAPRVHAATGRERRRQLAALRSFVEAYRRAAEALRAGRGGATFRAEVAFPPGCFPPGLPFVPAEAEEAGTETARSP